MSEFHGPIEEQYAYVAAEAVAAQPAWRWRAGEDDGWEYVRRRRGATLPVNAAMERWDGEEWRPFSAWTDFFHRRGG